MEGKIDSKGWLQIQRPSGVKGQFCPVYGDSLHCGDWCPLFGEPISQRIGEPAMISHGVAHGGYGFTGKTELQICQNRTLVFDKFTDERK